MQAWTSRRRKCTSCHDLKEVLKLRGYYTRAQWHDVIVTMKEYGAEVDDNRIAELLRSSTDGAERRAACSTTLDGGN